MRALLCLALLVLPAALEAQTVCDGVTSTATGSAPYRVIVGADTVAARQRLDLALIDAQRAATATGREVLIDARFRVRCPVLGTPVPPPAAPSPPDTVVPAPPDTVRPPVEPPPVIHPPAGPPPEGARLILGPQVPMGESPWPWYDANQVARGPVHATTYVDPTFADPADMYYYDLGLALYILADRTGDPADAARAHEVVSRRWNHMPEATAWGGSAIGHAPRTISLGSLILHALAGHGTERLTFADGSQFSAWEYIVHFLREQSYWLDRYVHGPALGYGVRDGGYMLLYRAQVAATHPDSAIRAEFREAALVAARDYYARLQRPDGGWYWEDGAEPWEQPFMVGLLLEGLIATHQLTGDSIVGAAILRSVDHLWSVYDSATVVPERTELRWRSFPYFVFPDGRAHGETNLDAGWDLNTIREARQRSVLIVHAFGYAYHITGDERYRERGDEIMGAAFGRTTGNLYDLPLNGQGPLADGLSSLADFRAREYNQAYRSSGRYLYWRR